MSRFRPDIEGLRAVAVLLVVGYHAGVPGLSGGYIGVDVFFVLSGYLITGLLVREAEASGTVSLVRFYARRARRLLPALLVVAVAAALVGAFVFAPFEQARLARTALMTVAYLSNVHFARGRTDYLGAAAETDPLLHTWSLAVEEQFYLVWPVLVLLGLGVLARRGAHPDRKRLGVVIGAVAVASFALCLWWTATRQPWAFFLSPPRAWEFAIGGLAVLNTRRFRADAALGWVGLGGILYAATLFGAQTPFPGWTAALPAFATVLVLRGAPQARLGAALGVAPLQTIGRLSYSWYLWHWPALVISAAALPHVGLTGRLVLAVGSLGLAALSYRFVEAPVRHSARLGDRASLGVTIGATVAGVALAFGWGVLASRAAQSPEQRPFTEALDDLPEVYATGCHADFAQTQADVARCTSGHAGSDSTVVLLGDSHAAQWQPALDALADTHDWRLVSLTKSDCPALDAPVYSAFLGRTYTECTRWRADAVRRIEALQPALIVVASEAERTLAPEVWEQGTARILAGLRQSGARVLLLRDTPVAPFDVPTCLARSTWQGRPTDANSCTFSPVGQRAVAWNAQQRAAAQTGARALDLTDVICPDGECQTLEEGRVRYRDAHHLSASTVRALAPRVGARLGLARPSISVR